MIKNIIETEINKICALLNDGLHDRMLTDQTDPFKMIQYYVKTGYEEDINIKKILKDQTGFHIDEGKYGTLKTSEVKNLVIDEIENYFDDSQIISEKISKSIDILIQNNAVFGFDGSGQNGCAAPSPTLLVLDVSTKIIYNIDLNPCRE